MYLSSYENQSYIPLAFPNKENIIKILELIIPSQIV